MIWICDGLPAAARDQLVRDYFDPVHGHGYTLGRVHINSCDFSLGHYAHVEQPDDFALESFSIERDRQALLPFMRAALRAAGRPLLVVRESADSQSAEVWARSRVPEGAGRGCANEKRGPVGGRATAAP